MSRIGLSSEFKKTTLFRVLAALAVLGGPACAGGGAAAGPSAAPPASGPAPGADQGEGKADPPNVSPVPTSAVALGASEVVSNAAGSSAVSPPPPAPAGTKVLHVGDSFAGALGIPLGQLLEHAGVRSILKHKDSSYLTTWAWEPELAKEIWHYNPDLVVVTLGANELGIADPGQREKTVRKIVETIGKRPCLWVAIPLWSERHNGLLEVIEKSAAPCVFYDTNERLDTASMPRIHDGIHPTTEARRAWADAVFDYLLRHRKPRPSAPWWLEDDAPSAD